MNAISVKLPSGRLVAVEVSSIDDRQPVSVLDALPLDDVLATVGDIAVAMHGAIEAVRPQEATIEFGVDVTLESGQLTTLLVKGSGKGTLKISLKWAQTT
jgi:hypothetical protein